MDKVHHRLGKKHSPETIKKMRLSAKGRRIPREQREKMRLAKVKNGWIDSNGYRNHRFFSKNLKEHRMIWTKYNGSIPDGHIIHHVNGDKLDNRIENLMCMSNSEHTKQHWKQGDIR